MTTSPLKQPSLAPNKVNWQEIDKKWQKIWKDSKDFETNPIDTKPKKFITVAYPYPNSPQHIGHGRTYTLADAHARFYRMLGYNVLFPMAFHYTGTPILGMAKRIQAQDKEIIDNLENIFGVSQESIKEFVEPINIADYFHKEIKTGMIEMGYSIDWRREFTTIDPVYKKFIQWQVNTLQQKDLIIQGSHPVGWCPQDENPVSQHDTLGDVEPDFTEYILIKFQYQDYIIPTATLRPETIFGVVNLWINPDIIYEKITVESIPSDANNVTTTTTTSSTSTSTITSPPPPPPPPKKEKWIVSKECAYKLQFLNKKITYNGQISGSELVEKSVTPLYKTNSDAPATSIVILPATFVQSDIGTGIVMSVPAHAPFDYQALQDLKDTLPPSHKAHSITPISIIQTDQFGDLPAKEIIEKMKITNQNDPRLEEATKQLYEKEFYGGKLKPNTTKEFAGTPVKYAKDKIKNWLTTTITTPADILLELTNTPVKCRCGANCVVKILNNQWFLNYKDANWKKDARACFDSMNILPSEIKGEFEYVVGWLRERACARQHGLGTLLPWDTNWIVESLSDSVIYMAYYTLARFVNDGTLLPQNLSDKFFEHIFLDKHTTEEIVQLTQIPKNILDTIKKEFEYFYPVDSRHSGRDLVPNHLTFFVLNHVAIFPKHHWPREVVVNGSILMKGSKMSKSMGNIIPLRQAIQRYGADPIRLAIIMSAELLQDADFNLDSIVTMQNKLEALLQECTTVSTSSSTTSTATVMATTATATTTTETNSSTSSHAEDTWIKSKTALLVDQVTTSIKKMRLREALHHILFTFESDLAWYTKRTTAKNRQKESLDTLHYINTTRVTMLAPFAPHISEEMWKKLGNSGTVAKTPWPRSDYNQNDNYDKSLNNTSSDASITTPSTTRPQIDSVAIHSEELLKSTLADITKIIKVAKITPQKIVIYTANTLKSHVYNKILQKIVKENQTNMQVIMKELIADPKTQDIKKNPDFVQKAIKDILSDPIEIRKTKLQSQNFDEKQFLESELAGIITSDFGVPIQVYSENDPQIHDPKDKAKHARPYKPALLLVAE